MRKKKGVRQKNNSEFIVNDTKYVPQPTFTNGIKGNIWSIWKKVDSGWVLAGQMFAGKTASKSSIIMAGHYLYPDQHKKFSIVGVIGRFRKVVDYLINKIKSRSGKSP
jgi:hypothetical protein